MTIRAQFKAIQLSQFVNSRYTYQANLALKCEVSVRKAHVARAWLSYCKQIRSSRNLAMFP